MSAWQTLGIEPTDDERVIKRAYAAKLKLIRPADDPEGFQNLREARDEAMYLSRFVGEFEDDDYDYDYDYDDASDDDEEDRSHQDDDTPPPPEPEDDWLAAVAPEGSITRQHGTDSDTDLENPIEPGSTPAGAAPLIDVREADTDPAEQPAPCRTITNEDIGEAAELTESDDDTLTLDAVDHELRELMGPWNRWEKQRWTKFISEIRESPFEISAYAERQILYALSEIIVPLTPRSNEERDNQHFILSYLDEEFGWRQNDRRVYEILPDQEAMQLMDFLRDRLFARNEHLPTSYYDAAGFPSLSAENFRDYLGKQETDYERYYRDCRDNGRAFRLSFSWMPFIFAPLWLAHRCNDGLEALVGIAYTIALVLIIYGINNEGSLMPYVGVSILAGLHILIGLFGKRLVISTMATALTELEMDLEMSDEDKLAKLKTIGQGGRKAISELIFGNLGIAVIMVVILAIFTGG